MSGGAKKAKGAPKPEVPEVLWTVRVSMVMQSAKASIVDVLGSLGSKDRPTRRMSIVFTACLICVALIGDLAVRRYLAFRHARQAADVSAKREESALTEFLKKQADLARRKNSMFELGQFTLELRSPAGEPPHKGVMNLADIDIVLECDSKDTRSFFEDNLPQARNQVTDVLVAMDRAELLSQDGKLRLKHRLMEKLNLMLPKGKVENLYFSKLILS